MKYRSAIVDELGWVIYWVDTLQDINQVDAILVAHPEWSYVLIEQSNY